MTTNRTIPYLYEGPEGMPGEDRRGGTDCDHVGLVASGRCLCCSERIPNPTPEQDPWGTGARLPL